MVAEVHVLLVKLMQLLTNMSNDGEIFIAVGILFQTITPEKVRLPLNKLHFA